MIKLRLLLTAGALAWLASGHLPDISVCGFLWLTGLECPLCGMTRAIAALLHGEWSQAIRLHALSPAALLILCGMAVSDCLRLAGRGVRLPAWVISCLPETGLAVLAIYGIARWPLH